MTAPLLELRKAYPQAEIHVVVTHLWAPLLKNHPAVDRVWPHERRNDVAARTKASARLALQLRKEHYDCVVNFHASPSSATISFATGAGVRSIHFHGHKDKNRYSTTLVPGKGTLKPIIERDMDTIRALGIDAPAGRMPKIFLEDFELRQAADRIRTLGLPGPILALGLGASRPTKSWPIERFALLAIEWCQKTEGSVLAVVGPDEGALADTFWKAFESLLPAAITDFETKEYLRSRVTIESGLPIRQLAAVLKSCSVFMGNDSGPKHIAIAVDTPTVTVFGPEHPFEWHPYSREQHPYFFIEDLPCRRDALPGFPAWCGLNVCEEEQHKCMRQIGVDEVLSECMRVSR
jgi:ADP-heptose:LPS heptosyltransferase